MFLSRSSGAWSRFAHHWLLATAGSRDANSMTKTTTGKEHKQQQGIQQLLRQHHCTRGWDSGQFRRNIRTATSSSGSNINVNVYGFIHVLGKLAKFVGLLTPAYSESQPKPQSPHFSLISSAMENKFSFINKILISAAGR
jgi:hypothetical protein